MKYTNTCIFALLLLPVWLCAQNLLPPIHNYNSFEYNAASKNWCIAVDNDGELFVANNSGLLYFNGEEWILNKLPNKTIVRSVAYINGKVYTGSYEEFGYWEKDSVGLLQYTSLTHLIKNHTFTSEEFWQILPYGDDIIFRSFSSVYIYKGDSIEVVDATFVVTNIALYNDRIIVAGEHKRLFWLTENTLAPLVDDELLADKVIIDMDVIDSGLLIGTKLNGCFLLKDDKLQPFEAEINGELKQHQLNQVLPLGNGRIAFGTIKNGIYLYDPVNKTYENLNRKTGLQNNTVLAMLQFGEQLWVGLDNGIDRIRLNNPITYYTDYTGAVGTVYDLAIHNNMIYLGSNTGIFYFQEDDIHFVEGSQGHVWDLEVIYGDLFGGHNTGTFILREGKLEKISDIAGGYQMVKIPGASPDFLQGTYTGMGKFEKDDQGQWSAKRVSGIVRPIKHLCFENPSTLWAAHPYKGLYRIEMDKDHNAVTDIQEFKTDVIPNNYNIKIYNIKNQIVILSHGVWYKYDPIPDRITVFEEFQDFNNMDLAYYDDEYFWFIDNEDSKEVIYTDLKNDYFVLDDAQLRKRLAVEAETIIRENDSIYYFTLSDGFGKLNLSKFRSHLENFTLPQPRLNAFLDEERRYSLMDTSFVVPYGKAQDITVHVSSASLVQPKYFYELRGDVEQSSYVDDGAINFQNLPYGEYELNVFTTGVAGERSKPKRIAFKISPPWYLSIWSIVIYALGLLGVVFLVRSYNRRKLERKHNKLKEKLHREQEERLARLEKEKLAKEVKLKQKELASTTMNVAKKNELILELKELLLTNKDKFSNQQRYRAFIKKLNSSINDDEDWKHFEISFKELHEDFFEILLGRYPTLTPKDLKLCAYLKMNLSSKEIAPLMGITTRGVEIHRYRLRKKIKIDASQNISNFLITLK